MTLPEERRIAFISVGLDSIRLIFCTEKYGRISFMPLFVDTLFARISGTGAILSSNLMIPKGFKKATWYTNIRPNGRTHEMIRLRFTNGYLDHLSPPQTQEEIDQAISELRTMLLEQSIDFSLPGDRTNLSRMIREGKQGNKYNDLLAILNLTYSMVTNEEYDFSEIASVQNTEEQLFQTVVREIKPELTASRRLKYF